MSSRAGIPAHLSERWRAEARKACARPGVRQTRGQIAACVSATVQERKAEYVQRADRQPRADGCPAPSPLAAALASGEKLRVEKRGKSSCAVVVPDGVLSYYRSCENANAAIQRAKCQLAPLPGASSGKPAAERRRTFIVTPQSRAGDPARYELVEASDVIASHSPHDFTPDPRYPESVQERLYHEDKNEQAKVVLGSQNLNPIIVLNTSPTPTDGPPMLTEDGCALGGNGRSMMIKRAYDEGGKPAREYREELEARAAEFGLDPARVRQMKAPVLVRVVQGTRCDSPPRELVSFVRRYNQSLTNAMDAMAKAVANARQLSPSTIALFGELLAGEGSLRDQMRDNPRVFIRALESDGIITGTERSRYVTQTGQLTPSAKEEIEGMFLGRVMRDATRIVNTPPELLRKIERAVPSLAMVAASSPDHDLTADLLEAVDLLNSAKGTGHSLEGSFAERELALPGEQRRSAADARPEVRQLARLLEQQGVNQLRDRFKLWAKNATLPPMLGKPPTREEAFQELVSAAKVGRDRPLFRGTVVGQDRRDGTKAKDLLRIDVVGDGKPKSEDGTGLDVGKVKATWLSGSRKGEQVTVNRDELGETVS
jgi:hypothetical protein